MDNYTLVGHCWVLLGIVGPVGTVGVTEKHLNIYSSTKKIQ